MTHDAPVVNRLRTGLFLALLSASSFGLSGALARGMMDAGWSPAAVVAVRVLVGGVALLPIALRRLRGDWDLLRRKAGLIVAYGLIAVAGTQLAYFYAVAHLAVGAALLIEYTAPIVVIGWLWARHGQKPGRATVLGAAWALAAMFGAAVYFVLSARSSDGLPGTVLATGGLLLGGVVLLLAGAAGIAPLHAGTGPAVFADFTAPWWWPLLALGVVTAALAYASGIAGTRLLGSRLASFAALIEVVAAIVYAWVLLAQTPRPIQFVGGALILVGVVIVRMGERPDAP